MLTKGGYKMRYKITGFNNTDIVMLERETFTLGEAIATARYLNTYYNCDFVVVVDTTTNKHVYTIG